MTLDAKDKGGAMQLYLVHVGYYEPEIDIYEHHTNFFIAASDIKAARKIMKERDLFIQKKMHVDAIQELSFIDGYKVRLEKTNADSLENKIITSDEMEALT